MQGIVIRVTGKVQGVFFRSSACERAQSLGIVGFVRNEPDGSVYIEAQGKPDKLQKFVAWCHMGPAAALVRRVDVAASQLNDYTAFRVL